jgi:O-antigen/teichoic acid export membrane protein
MQKSPLHRLHLEHFQGGDIDIPTKVAENGAVENSKGTQQTQPVIAEQPAQVLPVAIESAEGGLPTGELEARHLLKRTPGSYLLNQAYGLWFFISSFFLTVIITRKLDPAQYGVYAVAMAAFNTIAYIVALGLEDATYTYVPRVFAVHGRAAAARLIKRLLTLRIAILVLCLGILLFTMPLLAQFFAAIPIAGSATVAASLRDPTLLGHITPIAFYVLGNGIVGIISAVCAALMRMRIVFILGSVTQVFLLGLGYVVLQLGFGINGMLWLMASFSLLNAAIFLIWLLPILLSRGATYTQPLKPVLQLGIWAWQTNLITGALLKQVSIVLLGYFAVSITAIGYFNLSFQLGHAASLLLVTGFGGVAGAALAAAYVGQNSDRLARSWQTLIKVETILAAPILVFCLFNAQNIALVLYGPNYAPVGQLLAIFLFFNIIIRVLGTTIHQPTMYVLGKAKLVVLSMWIGLIALALLDILLIPRIGPAGALVADGLSQIITAGLLLAFLWRVLPRKYPLGFTLRLLLGLTIAALPGIVWHPTSRTLLGVSGTIFLILCVVLLMVIKPLNAEDMEMIGGLNKRLGMALKWFARKG